MSSRAARRREERAARKAAKKNPDKQQYIQLQNPVGELFEAFIVGNAQYCEKVVQPGTAEGQHIVICGAGPSLAEEAEEWCRKGDQLWGANSALPWLHEHGFPVTHGITVDQTPAMCVEWKAMLDVRYLIPSTSHPHLVSMLLDAGRDVTWFHSHVGLKQGQAVAYCACGHDRAGHGPTCWCGCATYDERVMAYEEWLYTLLYPTTVVVGSGLNTVTRAIDVALCMGAAEITVLGADCALRVARPLPAGVIVGSIEHKRWLEEETVMHADGGHALASGATPVTLGGEIDGRWWETKPDLAISALHLVAMAKALEGRLRLVGDTLPNAIKDKPSDFLDRMPTMIDSSGKPIRVVA